MFFLSFFTSTLLHAVFRLEKCMHTDIHVDFEGSVRGSLVPPLDHGVLSVLGKSVCREV